MRHYSTSAGFSGVGKGMCPAIGCRSLLIREMVQRRRKMKKSIYVIQRTPRMAHRCEEEVIVAPVFEQKYQWVHFSAYTNRDLDLLDDSMGTLEIAPALNGCRERAAAWWWPRSPVSPEFTCSTSLPGAMTPGIAVSIGSRNLPHTCPERLSEYSATIQTFSFAWRKTAKVVLGTAGCALCKL